MNKKRMKRWLCYLLCFVTAFTITGDMNFIKAEEKNVENTPKSRETLSFNTDWLYSDTEYSNGEVVGLIEDEFESVTVPHANTILDSHKGNDFISKIRSYRFTSWYRRHFSLPEDYRGQRILIDFEGVANIADVYVNGKLLATHKGAYTGFSVDITDEVQFGGADNVIAVKVNSKKQASIPPEGGSVDYCLFGGIVRDVNMTIVNPAYIEYTFVTTPGMIPSDGGGFGADVNVKSTETTVKNQVDIKNVFSQEKTYTVEIEVLDAEGVSKARTSTDVTLPANAKKTVTLETEKLTNVHLWDIEDPYQYTLVTKMKEGSATVDTYETKFGMRKFGFKKKIQAPFGQDNSIGLNEDGAFYLNGKPIKIRGINRHEQWPWIGRAVPNKLQARDADLIKASGINAVRCSHYPQDPAFLERCDEIGLLVFEEPPGWQHIGNDEWKDNFKTNLTEMILRDRNHPSIVSWGTSPNESVPTLAFNRECDALSKQLDPTRPTHGVRKREDYPYQTSWANENYEVTQDIFTPNYTYPEPPRAIPYIVAEHAFDWWDGSYPDSNEADAIKYINTFAGELDYFYRNKTVAGGFGWSMFDYNNEVNYTASQHVFYSGLYDLFRNDKPVAGLYRSQWDPDNKNGPGPMIQIANKWGSNVWKNSPNVPQLPQSIYVFSNCDEVELFRDNVSLGKIKPNKYTNLPHPIFEFKIEGTQYGEGDLRAVGYINGVEKADCERQRSGEPVKLEVKMDYNTLVADGTDMTSVSISALDARGNLVPFANNVVNVTQTDGTETTLITEKDVKLEGGRLAFLVQSKRDKTGTATFKVESQGLTPAECTITIDAFEADNLVSVPETITPGTVNPGIFKEGASTINDDEAGDKDYQFNYQGQWTYGSQAGSYLNDNTYSNKSGDTASITFSGSQIRYFGSKAANHGVASFRIDDGPEIRVDCYAASRQDNVLLFDSGYLNRSKKHTLTIKVTGDKHRNGTGTYVNADRVEIAQNKIADTTYSIDDSSSGTGKGQFEYSSGWVVNSATSDTWTEQSDQTATFRFTGTHVKLYASKDQHHGIGAISVDGGAEKNVDFYHASRMSDQLLFDSGELEPGDHELKIRSTGEKSSAAIGSVLVVERVEVSNSAKYAAELSEPYWFETLGWTVDVANAGTAGLDSNVVLASYNDDGVMTDKSIKDCSGDNYLEVGEEKTLGVNLTGDFTKVKAFLWDSEDFRPIHNATEKAVQKTAAVNNLDASKDTEITVITDELTSLVKVRIKDANLTGKDVSLVCYDPSGDGVFTDMNKNADAMLYLNQYHMENESLDLQFKLKDEPKKGTYHIVIGSEQGMVLKSFSFKMSTKPEASAIEAMISAIARIDLSGYTEESVSSLWDAVNAAEGILEKEAPTAEEIAKAQTDLMEALSSLQTKESEPVGSKLETAKKFAETIRDTYTGFELSKYTDTSKNAFSAALDNLNKILAKESPTVTELEESSANLIKAAGNLELKKETGNNVDKASLRVLYQACASLDKKAYTDDSVKVLTSALANADIVLRKQVVSQTEVTKAEERLLAAVKGLKVKAVAKPPVKPALKKGDKFNYKNMLYKITNVSKGNEQVSVIGASKKTVLSVSIPASVTYQGKKLSVTAIETKAFSNYKKLQKVSIGSNVTSIGKQAFYNSGKLKSIIISSSKINKVGSQALKGIYKKAIIKVPKKAVTRYKKLFHKKGQAKTVVIK